MKRMLPLAFSALEPWASSFSPASSCRLPVARCQLPVACFLALWDAPHVSSWHANSLTRSTTRVLCTNLCSAAQLSPSPVSVPGAYGVELRQLLLYIRCLFGAGLRFVSGSLLRGWRRTESECKDPSLPLAAHLNKGQSSAECGWRWMSLRQSKAAPFAPFAAFVRRFHCVNSISWRWAKYMQQISFHFSSLWCAFIYCFVFFFGSSILFYSWF